MWYTKYSNISVCGIANILIFQCVVCGTNKATMQTLPCAHKVKYLNLDSTFSFKIKFMLKIILKHSVYCFILEVIQGVPQKMKLTQKV